MEEQTEITQITMFHQIYPRVRVPETEITNNSWWYPDDTRLLDLYREALNTTSPKYQFLCFFAVIELATRIRKKKRAVDSVDHGNHPARERFDEPDWFRKILTSEVQAQVIGKKLSYVHEKILRPLRNQIAHALVEENNDESKLMLDDCIYPYLPVAKRLAERLLLSELGQHYLG